MKNIYGAKIDKSETYSYITEAENMLDAVQQILDGAMEWSDSEDIETQESLQLNIEIVAKDTWLFEFETNHPAEFDDFF